MTALAVKESSRERIQTEALRLFGRFGYDGVSLQHIADAAGLHKSTLFHYYRSKLEIALEVLEAELSAVVERLAPLTADEPCIEQLLESADALTDLFCSRPDAARLLMAFITAPEDSELRVPVPSRHEELERELFVRLGSWLERARKAGIVRQLNLRQTIVNLVGLVLFYPAVAEHLAGGEIAGPNPFSSKAVRIRKEELAEMIRRLFAP